MSKTAAVSASPSMAPIPMTVNMVKDEIEHNLGEPIFLHGPSGIGKSEIVHQIGAEKGWPVKDVRASQLDPTDIRGLPFVERAAASEDNEGNRQMAVARWAAAGFLPYAERDGEFGILFLDEMNLAPPLTQGSLYQLINDRAVGEYKLPPGWIVLAAGNRIGDRGAVYRMAGPLANRFIHYYVVPDVDTWVNYAYAQDVDPRIIGFIRFAGDRVLHAFEPDSEEPAFPSPRMWMKVNKMVKKRLSSRLLEDPSYGLTASICGCVGYGVGGEFLAFARLAGGLPEIDEIIKGQGGEPPVKPDLRHAVVAGITSKLISTLRNNKDQLSQAVSHGINYIDRIPDKEFMILFITDLSNTELAPEMKHIKRYQEWFAANGNLVNRIKRK